ncbi:hypothetical protein [Tenacibaculum sp. nBUS_03]|uniref:hypothetical protein n=1 Tax=Tenacibaculum sp. nBUS_03 TaxID=3395320 RepID=UPI003EBB2393
MKKKGLFYYFCFSCIVGSIVYIASQDGMSLPRIIRFYVNDFLIIPIVLSICLYVLRWSRGNKRYRVPFWIILYISLFYAIVFEYFLPQANERYTADIIDVFLYFISGILFYYLQKRHS